MARSSVISRLAAVVMMLLAGILPFACNSVKPLPSSTVDVLELVRQNRYVSVSLSAIMTYNDHGNNITSPRDLGVYVPIVWNGTTFSGNNSGPTPADGDVIDFVHGMVTQDGAWVEHISFWRIVSGNETNVPFDITFYALPIVEMSGVNVTRVGTFERTGDIKKHVLLIDCVQDGVTYVCTDWQNTEQPPVIKVRFDRESLDNGF